MCAESPLGVFVAKCESGKHPLRYTAHGEQKQREIYVVECGLCVLCMYVHLWMLGWCVCALHLDVAKMISTQSRVYSIYYMQV